MRAELYQGDCLELMKTLPDGCIDMVQLKRVCKVNAAKLFFSCNAFTIDLCASNRKEYRYRYVWAKTMPTNVYNCNRMPLRAYEEISVFYSKQPTYNLQKGTGKAYSIKTSVRYQGVWGNASASDLLHFDLDALSEVSLERLATALAEHGLTIEDVRSAQLSSAHHSSAQLSSAPCP